jgi:hypothetical protein
MMQLSAKKYYPNLGGKDVKKNKALKVLATSALLASVAAPFGAGIASANSNNQVDKNLKVSTNATLNGSSNLIVAEDDIDFGTTTSDTFRVTLPSGVTWNSTVPSGAPAGVPAYVPGSTITIGAGDNTASVKVVNDQVLEVRPTGANFGDGETDGKITIPLSVKLNGASGELKVTVDRMDSTVDSGSYTFAVANSGKTVATVDDVKNIGKIGTGGKIRIEENATGAVSGNQTLKLKLPSNFEWNGMGTGDITLGGGWATGSVNTVTTSDNELTVSLTGLPSTSDARGYLYVTPKIKADKDAAYGDVTVSISGDSFSDADVVVAKYGDYGVTLKVESVEELTAGKFDENTKTAKITIEEATPGSLVAGRDIDVQFPSWVKVVDVSDWAVSGSVEATKPSVGATNSEVDGTDDNFSINITNNSTNSTINGKIEFKVRLSVEANKTGDIEATVGGAGVEEQKLVVAKAIAPAAASLEGEAGKFKIGAQDQAAPVFYITEAKKGTFEKSQETGFGGDGEITVKLPTGVKFSKVPTVEVVEGDGTIDTSNVRRTNDDNVLSIPVKGESITKPMKIKVSNVSLTLDRTVAEGPIQAKIGGSAVVENYTTSKGWIQTSIYTGGSSNAMDPGEFNTQNAVTFTLGSTVTPAPGDTTASNIVFKLNSKTYTVDGKEFEMDAAPLVGWDRAYLPVRFAANALNVSDDQIIWDDKTSTFTVFKGDRVVSGKVGDKFLTVNGAKVPMDVPVWRNKAQTNDRVMVPIRYLANALNANIEWNKETSEITIEAAK